MKVLKIKDNFDLKGLEKWGFEETKNAWVVYNKPYYEKEFKIAISVNKKDRIYNWGMIGGLMLEGFYFGYLLRLTEAGIVEEVEE